jgi:hypothetical protein
MNRRTICLKKWTVLMLSLAVSALAMGMSL